MEMKIICEGRGQGKTYKLILESSKLGGTILCRDTAAKDQILEEARKMGLIIPEPATYREVLGGFHHNKYKIRGYLIDDADIFISTVVWPIFQDTPILGVSIGPDNIPEDIIQQLRDSPIVQKLLLEGS